MDKRQAGALAAVILSLWGAIEFLRLEHLWNNQFRDPYVIRAQHTRLEGARELIPPDAVVGYITDIEPNSITWSATFNGAQYVLAPRVLVEGTGREWLLANFAKEGDFPAFAKANGFRIERDFGNGVVVMRKEAR